MFDTILEYVEGNGLLLDSVVRKTRTQLHFTNGSKIVALPCGRKGRTLRGATAHFVIVDEAAFVPEEVILGVSRQAERVSGRKVVYAGAAGRVCGRGGHVFFGQIAESTYDGINSGRIQPSGVSIRDLFQPERSF